jgi:phosphoribosylformylglycinamidine synthase
MQGWLANVLITLKPVVNDPPGLAIRDALHNLGYEGVESVRSGKYLQVRLNAQSEEEALRLVDDMCKRLLANPVIEGTRDRYARAYERLTDRTWR